MKLRISLPTGHEDTDQEYLAKNLYHPLTRAGYEIANIRFEDFETDPENPRIDCHVILETDEDPGDCDTDFCEFLAHLLIMISGILDSNVYERNVYRRVLRYPLKEHFH